MKKISYIRNGDLESYGYLIKTINNLDVVEKPYSDLVLHSGLTKIKVILM